MKRVLIALTAVFIAVWMVAPQPEAADLEQKPEQKKGGRGGGGGGQTLSCLDENGFAELDFAGSIVNDNPVTVALRTNGKAQGPLLDDSGQEEALLRFDFTGTQYTDPGPDVNLPMYRVNVGTDIRVDDPDDPDAVVDCLLLGMEIEPTAKTYTSQLTFWWYEGSQEWRLRFMRNLHPEPFYTWVNIVRTNANTWVLTTRDDEGSDPEHFGSLEKAGSGKGKNKNDPEWTQAVMPLTLTVTGHCEGIFNPETGGTYTNCPVGRPGSGSPEPLD